MSVKTCNNIQSRKKPNDKIYTPDLVVDLMLEFCDYKEGQNVLECAKGKGAIYDKLKEPKSYCEIDENIDFFLEEGFYELCISNPPYSLLDKWLEHTYKVCNKFCYLIGHYSLTPKRIETMNKNNFYITKILLTQIPNWFQRSYIIVAEKKESGNNTIVFDYKNLGNKCLYCGYSCGGMRGKNIKHCKRKPSENVCRY